MAPSDGDTRGECVTVVALLDRLRGGEHKLAGERVRVVIGLMSIHAQPQKFKL